ncbi:TPA: hypothetical protein ACN2JY_001454 [Staphylococcus aureus]
MKKQELKQSIGVNVFKDGSVATKKKKPTIQELDLKTRNIIQDQ